MANQLAAAQGATNIDMATAQGTMSNQLAAAQGQTALDMASAQGQTNINMATAQGDMSNQQLAAQGAMQQQLAISQGAGQQQQQIQQGAFNAQQLGVSQINQQAAGQWQADMMGMQGDAAVQAANYGQLSTGLGMDYGMLAGANAGVQGAYANQMSGMGMEVGMWGQQAANNPFSQILDAGAKAAGAYFGAGGSDRRLKKNINKIGKSPSGLNIYSFEYIDSKYGNGLWQGVMSDEIPHEAVIQMDNGYDAVNYNMLDVEFKQI
jgi:hypothetical protein